MTDTLPPLDRRRALRWLISLPVLGRAALAGAQTAPAAVPATPFPEGVSLLVAGPEGGNLDFWSRLLVPALTGLLPADMRRTLAGGADGLTGTNQFEARALPDGASALLVPGTAALAWLAGDDRAKFDPTRWAPLMAGICPGLLVGRVDRARLVRGQKLRIAASGQAGPEIAAVLGLELLGLEPVPVTGMTEPGAMRTGFSQHAVDVVLLRGGQIGAQLPVLIDAGARPICTLGMADTGGRLGRDPAWAELPHLGELVGGLPAGKLTDAWCAVAAAARLAFGLVLPQLTPAAMIALWRRAIEQAVALPELQAAAIAQGVRLQASPEAAAAAVAADAPALQALRQWLATRLSGRAG